jgi:hypothetical protein
MNISVRKAPACWLVLALLYPFIVPTLFAQEAAAATGLQWQTTSQMTMEGMDFRPPAQTHTRCMPAEWNEPPGSDDGGRGCVNSNFDRFENTVTWTSTCSGPPEMAGMGEIIFADETGQSYTGKLNYSSDEGSVVIDLTGKVVGSCELEP